MTDNRTEIFKKLKGLLKKYEPPFVAKSDFDSRYELSVHPRTVTNPIIPTIRATVPTTPAVVLRQLNCRRRSVSES